ncbi:MAG: GIY-YIG nuclease family protein [Bacteroidota bacterium]
MAEQTFVLHISGYWRDQNRTGLTRAPGLFFVYESRFDEGNQTVDLLRLIYAGEADNVRDRIMDHEKYPAWQGYLAPGNELCYAFAPVEFYYRERVRAAFIINHKPPANAGFEGFFPFDKTTLVCTGRTALIDPVITVRKNTGVYPETAQLRQQNKMIPVKAVNILEHIIPSQRFAFGM